MCRCNKDHWFTGLFVSVADSNLDFLGRIWTLGTGSNAETTKLTFNPFFIIDTYKYMYVNIYTLQKGLNASFGSKISCWNKCLKIYKGYDPDPDNLKSRIWIVMVRKNSKKKKNWAKKIINFIVFLSRQQPRFGTALQNETLCRILKIISLNEKFFS
jgi:hypothetical protein